ncbi:MAG: tetratricopeptide repeat protein, partial [Chloroflexi bacterium]|nr:tetratricopeptide repeat protein [Chloroflexota bacterium]
LRLAPVMFELGARPHPPKDLYRAYLDQSDIFLGIYWQKYGWVAPDMDISGLEDEWRLSGDKPKLIYIRTPAPDRDARLKDLLDKVRNDDRVSYKPFSTPDELRDLIENDLALLLTERFAISQAGATVPAPVVEAPRHNLPRHNLPLQLTHFIGRERELIDLKQAVLTQRLVTLLGPGGAGKTRLSLQAANELLDTFEDGVWLIELAPLRDAALIAQTVAETLNIREEPGRPLMTTLFDRLRTRHTLLILDNCEHLIEASAQFANALLRACANLRLIVSSREALGIAGEMSFRVPPLAVPDPRQLPSLEALKQFDAVKLFADRATMALPSFTVTDGNAAAIAQICHRLDGIPLAIELAAARVKMLKAEQIAARLDDRFKLLTSGSRTALPRQQTLRAAIDWSYELLNATERAVMRRLAVCVSGWTLEAAEAIGAGEGVGKDDDAEAGIIFDVLDSLLNKSMIVVDYDQDQAARYRLLETMRDYAQDKLREAGELERSQQRHLDFYLALAETAEPELWRGRDRAAWLNRLEMEHANLRVALTYSQTSGAIEITARLASSLGQFWNERALFREGRQWLEAGLTQRERLSKPVLAQTLRAAARLAGRQGDFDQAETCAQESVSIWRELGDRAKLAQALNTRAAVASERGEVERSATYNAEVLTLYRELNDRRGVAQALSDVGWAAVFLNDYARGIPLLEESLTLERQFQDTLGVAWGTLALGTARMLNGNIEAAATLLHESLTLYRPTENKWYIAGCLEGLASVASAQQQPERAARLLGAHDRLVDEMGAKIPVFWERSIRQPLLAQLNAQIEAQMFEAAMQAGRRLTLNQAIELALNKT